VRRHASRGRIAYILRGSPTIPSMIPMVLSDNIPTRYTPHRQTALAGILLSGFTSIFRSGIVRSSGSRLPTPAVARMISSPAKSLSGSTQDNPNRWNLHSTPPGDTVISEHLCAYHSTRFLCSPNHLPLPPSGPAVCGVSFPSPHAPRTSSTAPDRITLRYDVHILAGAFVYFEQAMQQEKMTSSICFTIILFSRNKKRKKALSEWLVSPWHHGYIASLTGTSRHGMPTLWHCSCSP
jgi:hypothetical protein